MIQRQLHIYCDQCGAEGPHIVGEKRPALLQDVVKLGWQVSGSLQRHVCMECMKPKEKVVLEHYIDTPAGRVLDKTVDITEDRSRHWTAARMEKP